MYEVNVAGVMREPLTSRYMMMLEAVENSETDILIPVGKFEAENISSRKCSGKDCKKSPYDILTPILDWVDSAVFNKLVIDDCECGIFTAKLYLTVNGEEKIMDCRPSDGVVLALDRSIPVFVAKVLTCSEGVQ
ncbi:putative cytoplasmic protein [Denitrovibrio acetiphilus DSM 12809]|uniref:Putative cytoplasmic protein n=1 Tax=Denitrovibrio acetiphilus (strain DSM 12809 / NBRC 114555 / N2460) TaxID=522772 RepID=D4H0U9_DENA2|nr:bifunctional nuclease domain-containing protein [Denitrovibrio acetiphilus]ADD68612.1 putative cytoplasmic protein [Denitrovibrio acetiphilus DSM 12809]